MITIDDLRPGFGENAEVIPGLAKTLVNSKEMGKAWKYLARKKIPPTQLYRIVLHAYEGALIEKHRESAVVEKQIFDGIHRHARALSQLATRASKLQLSGTWWQFGREKCVAADGKEVNIPWQAFWFYFDLPNDFKRDENHSDMPIVTLTELCKRATDEAASFERMLGGRAVERRRYDVVASSLVRRLDAAFRHELSTGMPSVIHSIVCALVPNSEMTIKGVGKIAAESPIHLPKPKKKLIR